MKIIVPPKMKGKFGLSCVYGSFIAGQEVPLTKEQINSFEVQNSLRAGLLEAVDGVAINEDEVTEYKNTTPKIQSFGFGTSVRPHQTFLIASKLNANPEIQLAIREGRIAPTKAVETKVETKKEKVVEAKKESKKIKKVSENVAEEVVEKKNVVKEKGSYIVDPNGELDAKKKVPEGVYVHDPNKVKNAPQLSPIEKQIAEIEAEERESGMKFADKAQAKEKLIKMQKSIDGKS